MKESLYYMIGVTHMAKEKLDYILGEQCRVTKSCKNCIFNGNACSFFLDNYFDIPESRWNEEYEEGRKETFEKNYVYAVEVLLNC